MDPSPHSRPWDESRFSAFFPRQWKRCIEVQGLPSPVANVVFLVMWEHLAALPTRLRAAESAGEPRLPPPPAEVCSAFSGSAERRFLATRTLAAGQEPQHSPRALPVLSPASRPGYCRLFSRGDSTPFLGKGTTNYFFKLFILDGGGREKETSLCGFLLHRPLLGTWGTTQACTPTANGRPRWFAGQRSIH